MRRILITAGLVVLYCGITKADSSIAPQPAFTYNTSVASMTTVIISVSTSATTGATQVDNPQMLGRTALEIQNIDASATLWCLPVSTTPTVNGGREIAPGGWWNPNSLQTYYQSTYSSSTYSVTVSSVPVKFWCLSDGSGATKAAVSQAY